MKKIIFPTISTMLFAKDSLEHINVDITFVIYILLCLIIFMIVYIIKSLKKIQKKEENIFNIITNDKESILKNHVNVLSANFDLQEIMLYFFKTLNYEASQRNNIFIVNQNMHQFTKDFIKKRPKRNFFGSYQNILQAIWAAVELLHNDFENSLIIIDLKLEYAGDNKYFLLIDVRLSDTQKNEADLYFQNLCDSSNEEYSKKLDNIISILKHIDGLKYAIRDNSQRINSAICLSVPLIAYDEQELKEIEPQNKNIKALIFHNSQEISSIIRENLESYNILSICNQTTQGLIDKISDSVSFDYRLVLIDMNLFKTLTQNEIDKLIKLQHRQFYRVIVIINNQNIPKIINAISKDVDFLALPYVTDNIRSLVNTAKIQYELYLQKNN